MRTTTLLLVFLSLISTIIGPKSVLGDNGLHLADVKELMQEVGPPGPHGKVKRETKMEELNQVVGPHAIIKREANKFNQKDRVVAPPIGLMKREAKFEPHSKIFGPPGPPGGKASIVKREAKFEPQNQIFGQRRLFGPLPPAGKVNIVKREAKSEPQGRMFGPLCPPGGKVTIVKREAKFEHQDQMFGPPGPPGMPDIEKREAKFEPQDKGIRQSEFGLPTAGVGAPGGRIVRRAVGKDHQAKFMKRGGSFQGFIQQAGGGQG